MTSILSIILMFGFSLNLTAGEGRKHTICGLTINSPDEFNVFKETLPNDRFEFVELTNLVKENDQNWFDKVCKSGIVCDVLVISGHFAGTFFGVKSQLQLPYLELERHRCNKDCIGILEAPVEVYLYGCNTLAGKNRDTRTPEQYRAVLRGELDQNHNRVFTDAEVELFVIYRYGDVGFTNSDKACFAFNNTPHIYGYCSTAPLGDVIKTTLKSHFTEVSSSYYDYIAQEKIKKINKDFTKINPNQKLAGKVCSVNNSFTECKGLYCGGRPLANDKQFYAETRCFLQDENILLHSKLEKINSLFKQGKEVYIPYLDVIMFFFERNQPPYDHADSIKFFNNIKENQTAKNELKKLLKSTQNFYLIFSLQLTHMMFQLDWLDQTEYSSTSNKLLQQILDTNRLDDGTVDSICALPIRFREFLGKSSVLFDTGIASKLCKNEYGLEILKCLYIKNINVLREISKQLENNDVDVRYAAAYALADSSTRDEQIISALAKALDYENSRFAVAFALGHITPQSQIVNQALINALKKEKNKDSRWRIILTLKNIKPKDDYIHVVLAKIALEDKEDSVRKVAIEALGECVITNKDVINMIELVAKESSGELKKLAEQALVKTKSTNK